MMLITSLDFLQIVGLEDQVGYPGNWRGVVWKGVGNHPLFILGVDSPDEVD